MGKDILLGKKTQYTDTYTTKDLYAINRESRRKGYVKMYGMDIWTAYEFSFLLPNGLPQFHVIRIINPADTVNIFESKGLKLYLNSFNNTVFESLSEAISVVKRDLNKLTEGDIDVTVVDSFIDDFYKETFTDIDREFEGVITQYNYDKNLLQVRNREDMVNEKLRSSLLRSNCEVTEQPDWGSIYIEYEGRKSIDHDSLLRYIVSYRKHKEFHEPTCERIYQDLYRILDPSFLLVICQYTRRGGIDINPIRCNIPIENIDLPKTLHQ